MAETPVRVKLYGMFPTTKRRYVGQLVVAAVLVTILLGVWIVYRLDMRSKLGDIDAPALKLVVLFFDLVPWFVLAFVLLQSLEAYFVFRAFARKRAEQTPPPQT